MCAEQSLAIRNRLNRVAGQVAGISRMIEEGAYCIDILTQLQAALAKAEDAILKQHADGCVAEAIASGDPDAQRAKFNELVDLIAKSKR
ncbi:copper-sensing transcriptional repressor CsoR family protein [Devosia limi DSM 17137]|uniref:Copper-sensing transcriptional repressor CsoR family protein n=1 Tax=Devosia limi DSM 17137 TaxID=1121477 RepID=A0A0F5LQW4_9HYPH|nr:metal-sensitive transcriptional regulator [Devosia limi]KKB84696.1 copper-sensing transcriptional repressor CsoR family protein [Devosia limi DSM 17137]SHF53518.1 DNA-binding transcriptional regulator, FrmR family [Devosia limi DSM 17137]